MLLAVRVVQKGSLLGYCTHELWETPIGTELDPEVERVIYDLDEEQFVCVFTIAIPLQASFWYDHVDLTPGTVGAVDAYFRHMRI